MNKAALLTTASLMILGVACSDRDATSADDAVSALDNPAEPATMTETEAAPVDVSPSEETSSSTPTTPKATPAETGGAITQLVIKDGKVGEGDEATAGKEVAVHYTGWIYDTSAPESKGAKFDSSRDRGEAFVFPLGGGRVISGWDEGVVGMKEGGQRSLIIPPDMAYGEAGAGGVIPPNATLIFDVELVDVLPF